MVRYLCVVVLLGAVLQIYGMPVADPNNVIDVLRDKRESSSAASLYHQLICQKAVTYVSRDMEVRKRDDVLLNLVINVCLPDVTADSFQQLLQELPDHQSKSPTTSRPSWDEGLLPESGPGQEGVTEVVESENDPKATEETLTESEPGQGAVDTGGHAGEETDIPDWTDDWWDGDFPEIDVATEAPDTNDGDEPPAPGWRKREKQLKLLIALVANVIDEDTHSDSDETSTTARATTQQPTTEAPVPSTARATTKSPTTARIPTTPPIVNTEQDVDSERALEDILRRLMQELQNRSPQRET